MKRPKQLTLLIALSLLSFGDSFAQDSRSTHLTRADKTFRAADVDANGSLNAKELSRASISGNSIRTWDKDQSGSFSRDEFVMYYRHLLMKSGQAPGDEFEAEAQRIEKLQEEEAKKRAEAARKQKAASDAVAKDAETLSTVEKYRRAQEALNERIKKLGARNGGALPAKELLGSRGQAAGTKPIAQGAAPKDNPAATKASQGGLSESVRARLSRVQEAQLGRAQSTGVGRGPVERAQGSLIDRAANRLDAGRGVKSEGSLADKLKKAQAGVAQDAVDSGAGRPRVQHTQESLTRRARQAVGVAYNTQLSEGDREGLPESARQKLSVSMEELAKRARAAGWTIEQFDLEKRRLVKRAKDAEADSQGADKREGEGEVKREPQNKPPVDSPKPSKESRGDPQPKGSSAGDEAKPAGTRDRESTDGGRSISSWQERVSVEDALL